MEPFSTLLGIPPVTDSPHKASVMQPFDVSLMLAKTNFWTSTQVASDLLWSHSNGFASVYWLGLCCIKSWMFTCIGTRHQISRHLLHNEMLNIDFDFVICVINFGNIVLNLLAFVLPSEIDTRPGSMVVSLEIVLCIYVHIFLLLANNQIKNANAFINIWWGTQS